MYSKYWFILLCILNFLSIYANGQSNITNKLDTIYIYETEIVYDTIFVFDTINVTGNREFISVDLLEPKQFGISILQLDTTKRNGNLIVISENYAATIPLKSIILNENIKNLESMKKLSFLGVMLFATQTMLFAQADFGISAGGGMWWSTSKSNFKMLPYSYNFDPMETVDLSEIYSVGLYLELPVNKRYLFLTEINYNFLSNAGYSTQIATRFYSPIFPTFEPLLVYYEQVGRELIYHQISIPLQVGYNLGRLMPLIGVEYSYKISSNMKNANNRFGALLGVKYKLSDKISLKLAYNHGLTKDYKVNGKIYDSMFILSDGGEYNVNWNSNTLGITLYYSFKKRMVKEECDHMENNNNMHNN